MKRPLRVVSASAGSFFSLRSLTRRQSPYMLSHFSRPTRASGTAIIASLVLMGACADQPVVDPGISAPTASMQRITCVADVQTSGVTCAPATGGANASLTLGGQGTYIELKAANSSYASNVFQADITLRNLTSQMLGSSDGTTVTGVKAFIASGPVVTSGSGVVTVNNADGVATFTAANQPYFLYNQILHQFSGTSSAKTWRFDVPATVTRFMFTVLVQASAPVENGVLRWTAERGLPTFLTAVWGADANNVFACGNSVCFRKTDAGTWVSMTGTLAGDSLGRTNSVLGIGGTSPTDIWAVGGGGLIAHYDGTKWTNTPNPGTLANQLNSVAAISPNDVYAVGLGTPKILHWNGTAWTNVQNLTNGGFQVRALSSSSVWVSGASVLTHWNGTAWSTIAGPAGSLFRGMWVFADNDIYVGGQLNGASAIFHYDGTSFTSTLVPAVGSIFGFWGFSPTNMIASDGSGNVLGFDGTSWTLVKTLPANQVANIWAASPSDIYLTGYNGQGYIHHYDGSLWTNQGAPMATLNALWGTGTDVYAVGASGTILRSQGSGWTNENSGTSSTLFALWGSSATDVWAAGGLGASILHKTGTTWASTTKATGRVIRDLWGSSAGAVWAVGDTGTIEKFDGTSWTAQASGVTTALFGVAGSGPSDVWAVGNAGTLLHFDGTAWTNAGSGVTDATMTLTDVFATSSTNAWILGSGTNGFRVILRWNGTTWSNVSSGMNGLGAGGATCLHGTGPNDIWAGGDWGVLFHWNGSVWQTMPTGASTWACPWAASATSVFAAGQSGVILHGTR